MATGDIREIDMTKATDANGKKIRLVGDDGKGYWMEFSDLAAVVGGLIDLSGKAIIETKIFLWSDDEVDNAVISGIYGIHNMSRYTHLSYSLMLVLTFSGYIFQIVFRAGNSGGRYFYVRHKENDDMAWTNFYQYNGTLFG